MTAAPAVVLDAVRARKLTRRLQEALDLSIDLLGQAFDGRAWSALGFPTWEAYCAAELPQLAQLRLPLEERRAAVAELRARGMSTRAIAAPLGLSVGTVHGDLKGAPKLATVTSLDGRSRPAAAAAAPRRRVCRTDRVVQLVADAGPDGVTVRDVCERFRWSQHVASATLTRLAAAGRITYRAPERRGQFGTYARRIAP